MQYHMRPFIPLLIVLIPLLAAGDVRAQDGNRRGVPDGDGAVSPSPTHVFEDTLSLGLSNLWIRGVEVQGPLVAVHYDGTALWFNQVALPFEEQEPPLDPTQDSRDNVHYAQVPRYQELRGQGLSIRDAVNEYWAEVGCLYSQLSAAYSSGGHAAAAGIARSSPLICDIEEVGEGTFRFRRIGLQAPSTFQCERAATPVASAAEVVSRRGTLARDISRMIKGRLLEAPTLVIIDDVGSVRALEGNLRSQALAQLEYARSGLPLDKIPAGPLSSTSRSVQLAHAGANGEQ